MNATHPLILRLSKDFPSASASTPATSSARGNVYGGAVNVAARIAGKSPPGEVLVSDTVRGLARTSAGVTFDKRGQRKLKGVGEPVRVWAVASERSPSTGSGRTG